MKRRAKALVLVGLLLGGYPAGPAVGAGVTQMRVKAPSADLARLRALCSSVRGSRLEVLVFRSGQAAWLEILAKGRGDLAAAVSALRQAAKDKGLKLDFRPAFQDHPKATLGKPLGGKAQAASRGTPPLARLVGELRPERTSGNIPPDTEVPKRPCLVSHWAHRLRGPPA